jgi:hypothetical protein
VFVALVGSSISLVDYHLMVEDEDTEEDDSDERPVGTYVAAGTIIGVVVGMMAGAGIAWLLARRGRSAAASTGGEVELQRLAGSAASPSIGS